MYSQTGTFHSPAYEQWSVGIQQALGDKQSVGLNYVGNHGYHIPIVNNAVNAIDPGYCGADGASPCFGGTLPLTRTAQMFNTTYQYYSPAVSNYNGVTATYSLRMTYGFTVNAQYTWSHTLDEVSNGGLESYGTSSLLYQWNPQCLRCNNYGNADYDI